MWANRVVYIAVELEHDPVENSIQEDKTVWQAKVKPSWRGCLLWTTKDVGMIQIIQVKSSVAACRTVVYEDIWETPDKRSLDIEEDEHF